MEGHTFVIAKQTEQNFIIVCLLPQSNVHVCKLLIFNTPCVFLLFSGSILGGLVGTLSYFYNHGEVRCITIRAFAQGVPIVCTLIFFKIM